MGKADVDGDAAALFFFQAVGVDAGEGFDQRGLAVIDGPGGTGGDGFHFCRALKVSGWFPRHVL